MYRQERPCSLLYKTSVFILLEVVSLSFPRGTETFITTHSICARLEVVSLSGRERYPNGILVVCYQGPEHEGGYSLDEKMTAINTLFDTIVKLSNTYNPVIPIIGGADTNLDLSRARLGALNRLNEALVLPDGFYLHDAYTPTARRALPPPDNPRRPGRPPLGKIDYFFHYPAKLPFHMTRVMDIYQHVNLVEQLVQDPPPILQKEVSNHDPWFGTLALTSQPEQDLDDEDEDGDEPESNSDSDWDFDESDSTSESSESSESSLSSSSDSDSDDGDFSCSDSESDSEMERNYYKDGREVNGDGVDSDGEEHY